MSFMFDGWEPASVPEIDLIAVLTLFNLGLGAYITIVLLGS